MVLSKLNRSVMIILSTLLFSSILKGQALEQMFSIPPKTSKPDSTITLETDSSINMIVFMKDENRIKEAVFMKRKDSSYFIERYYDTKNIRTEGKSLDNIPVGIWYVYSNNGELEEIEDYEKGEWKVISNKHYPYYDLRKEMKNKGDSIIINNYSEDFLNNHVIWDFGRSCIYNDEGFGNWTEFLESPPNKYRLVYALEIEGMKKKMGESKIIFELDSIGNLIKSDNTKGLEDLTKIPQKTFNINLVIAKEKAGRNGLQLYDDAKIQGFINWESVTQKNGVMHNGRFKYYLLHEKEVKKNINPEARSVIEYKYDVYIFNPWNGEFIEKKRMKSITGWEKRSGSSTGLMLDE